MGKSRYNKSTWGLRVLSGSSVLADLQSGRQLFIGSVRKIFTVGELMDQIGPDYSYDTPVFHSGTVDGAGVLHGNLILVASGDLTMGGRTLPDGSIAVTDLDHNEADSLGQAELTTPDPLAGYRDLAQQVAAAGIKRVQGEVIIDDRLFKPYRFRDEFDLRPIFVNDDCVDVAVSPTQPGASAQVSVRPMSAAVALVDALTTGVAGSDNTLRIDPELLSCIGVPGCSAALSGSIPVDLRPPITGELPLVQTIRITEPANYARTVFIEALAAQGVTVDAAVVEDNPIGLLPPRNSYDPRTRLAQLLGMSFQENARLVLKVSYNLGSDTSLLLLGLTQGVDDMPSALAAEKENLRERFDIAPSEYSFVDGSGGGETRATNEAVTHMLATLAERPFAASFRDALPVLGVDGSLTLIRDFEADPTLRGARGQVQAKAGTFVTLSNGREVLRAMALAGYIQAKSGKTLIFHVVVNEVPVDDVNGVVQTFQDLGTIAALLWRDN